MNTILILDDEYVVRQSFVDYFEDSLWRVVQAETAEQALDLLETELQIMKSLDHPNIIKIFEIYKDQKYFHIVMEYCNDSDLFETLVDME